MKLIFKLIVTALCLSGILATSAQASPGSSVDFGPSPFTQVPSHHQH